MTLGLFAKIEFLGLSSAELFFVGAEAIWKEREEERDDER